MSGSNIYSKKEVSNDCRENNWGYRYNCWNYHRWDSDLSIHESRAVTNSITTRAIFSLNGIRFICFDVQGSRRIGDILY